VILQAQLSVQQKHQAMFSSSYTHVPRGWSRRLTSGTARHRLLPPPRFMASSKNTIEEGQCPTRRCHAPRSMFLHLELTLA
jgi:hypothetical protein